MKLLLIRHTATEPDGDSAPADDPDRGLAKTDRWRARTLAKGLHEIVRSVDLLACSGFPRACETAEILAEQYDVAAPTVLEALAPDARPALLLRWLASQDVPTVGVVGHAAHLSMVASLLVTGKGERWLPLKRGGACLIEIDEEPRAGAGRLVWVVTPAILRRV